MKPVLGSFFIFISLLVWPAHAAIIDAHLANASLTGAPGETLAFFATLSNPSAIDTIYLNGIGSTASSPFLNVDTSPFDVNAPLFLAPGEVSGVIELFDVTIDSAAPDGPYIGSFVSILGGADGGAGTSFDDLAGLSFDVNVAGASTAVPEPGTAHVIPAGLLALLAAILRRRTANSGELV